MPNKIAVIMGSESDLETVKETINLLKEFGIGFQLKVLSAHRTPLELAAYVKSAVKKGTKIFIAAAGGSAALAGVIAAHTIAPVIGIPIETSSLKGLDSLLSTAQMPGGIPVASMAIGKAGARNAALLAMQILAVSDKKLAGRIEDYRAKARKKIKSIKLKV